MRVRGIGWELGIPIQIELSLQEEALFPIADFRSLTDLIGATSLVLAIDR